MDGGTSQKISLRWKGLRPSRNQKNVKSPEAPGPTALRYISDHDMPASTALRLQVTASDMLIKRAWCKLPLSTGAGTPWRTVLG